MQVSANVTFIRKRIKTFDRRTSRYRGKGQLIIDDLYLTVKGRRAYTPVMEASLGAIFFLLSIYLISTSTDKVLHSQFSEQIIATRASVYILLVILSFYLVEYLILARDDFTVEFDAVNKFASYSRGKFVAISINELPSCSPVMFRCKNWAEVIHILRKKIPDKEFLP